MLLLVFGCITRLILVSYYTTLHYRIFIICLSGHFLFSLCPAYTVFPQYCYLSYVFLAIACLNHLNFIYEQIKYLLLAFDWNSVHPSLHTLCRCLAVGLDKWSVLATCLVLLCLVVVFNSIETCLLVLNVSIKL